jgi:polyhydroxybutyrate depolymerase
MRSSFVCAVWLSVSVSVVGFGLAVGACSDTVVQRVTTNPEVPEGGMVLDDGAVVDQDGAVVSDGAKGSLVDLSTGTVNGFTEADRGPYTLAVPKNYDAARKYPLIVVIHGDGGDGAGMRNYHPLDDETGSDAIVVYPTGNGHTWDQSTPFDSNPDQQYVEALINAMKAKYSIDRVFGVGWSSGGFLVNILACRRAGIFKAIVSHAGGQPYTEPKDVNGYNICVGNPTYPALITHGANDGTVDPSSGDYDAQFWAHYNGCDQDPANRTDVAPSPCKTHASCPAGKPVTFCLIPGNGHGVWSQAIPTEWAFLKAL